MEEIARIGTKTGLLNIVGELENVYKRPALYVGEKDNVEGIINFFQGFLGACDALGFGYSRDISRQVIVESGWEPGAKGVWLQMRRKEMSEEDIVKELVRLEIKKWQKLIGVLLASEA